MLITILRISFYLLFCITPFIFTKFNSELFEFNKMIFVYGLTIIISGTWLLRMVSEQKIIFKSTTLDLPLGLFLLSQIVSTVFSIDAHTSVWGYYSRLNGGLMSIISYILLYHAFVSNFGKSDVIKFLKGALFAGGLVSLYAIPEHFGLSPSCLILTQEFTASCWVQDVQARVFGTLGQPNWMAAYLGMLIFPSIYFFLSSKNFPLKVFYFLMSLVYYLAFTFTYSRGATLGLIAGLFVLGLSVAVSSRRLNDFTQLKLFFYAVVSLVFLSLMFGSALTQFRILKNPAVPARPGISNSQAPAVSGTQLENGGTESGQIRLIVWRGALDIFKAYPVFGSGVETFAYAYYRFRPNEHNLVSEWDFLYNKAHNEYLNYLATTGAFGFLTYSAIIITFLIWSLRNIISPKGPNTPDNINSILPASLLAGYVSYLIQNFFLFSVVMVALLFYLYPAFTFVYLKTTRDLPKDSLAGKIFSGLLGLIARKNLSRKLIQVLIVIIVFLLLNSLFSIWKADTYFKKGSDYNDAGNPGRAYNFLIEAVRLNPNEPLYLSELGNAAAASALAISADDATVSAELVDDSILFTDLALAKSPSNTTVLRTAIRTFFQLTLLNPEMENKTLEIVDKSISLAPNDPKLLINKAVILTQLNRRDEAIDALKKAIELRPNYREARLQLGDLYIKNNQKDLAKEQIEYVLKLIPGDGDAIKLQEQL